MKIIIQCKSCKKKKGFIKYTIPEGEHYSNHNKVLRFESNELNFKVKFDDTSIYTLPEVDQHDINKLIGFSDNNSHHQRFSARFGWRYSDNFLRLFAYVYNEGTWTEQELSTIETNKTYTCSIVVNDSHYLFIIKELNINLSMIRLATTPQGKGYRLYPYFGGNNPAPHDVYIWIKYLK